MLETLLSLDTSALLWARTLVGVEYAKYVQISGELIVILAAIILIGLWLKGVQKKDNRYKIWALEITFTIGLTFIFYSIINLGLPQDWRESPQVVANGIKPLIPHPVDNSFPSGHALFTAALLVGIIRFFRNKYLIGLTIIIG
ncbi:phosphatase PAP2 family protein, partial [Candidatus Gracilibacteria bacterium]|nr:phosphatase PAP2 family protein [Candidatus Gracilibacteria bacterium]